MDANRGTEDGREKVAGGFAYFVIRIRRDTDAATGEPQGTIERLGSGRAHAFRGARELLEMLAEPASRERHR